MHEDESLDSIKSFFFPFTLVKAIHYLILIGFLVYGNSLVNGFVGDDNGQILTNPVIHSLGNLGLIFQGSTLYIEEVGKSAGLYYRPMLSATFALLYALFGPNAFPYHLFQLLLHISNSILILLLFRKHFTLPTAFVLSLVFLIHPINNEAVVYLSNMQEELFAFFGLMALTTIDSKRFFYSVPVFLFFSLLSKETGAIFIPVVILYYFFFCKRTIPKTKYVLLSLFVLVLIYTLTRISIGNIGLRTEFLYMSQQASFTERLLTIPSLLSYYVRVTFLPIHLAIGWYWVIKKPDLFHFVIPLITSIVFLSLLLIAFLSVRNSSRYTQLFLFFLSVFSLSIGIILQIFPLDLTVADRWFYLPLLGLLGIGGVIYEKGHQRIINGSLRKMGMTLLICVLLFYAGRDMIRNTNWIDSYTLCSHDVQVNKQSYILEFCVSNELYNRKDYVKAEMHAKKAVELYPEYFLSWYTLGKVYYAIDQKEKAKTAFSNTLAYNEFSLGSEELALLYVYEKNTVKSREILDTYLSKMPHSAQLWYALALTEYLDGHSKEATAAAEQAYMLHKTPITEKVYLRLSHNLPIVF